MSVSAFALDLADLDQFWISAGVGADLSLGAIYLRPELLVGFKF